MANFSVKEKDEASLSNSFRQDLLNAFILHFAEVKAFLFFMLLIVVLVIQGEKEGRERGRLTSTLVSQPKTAQLLEPRLGQLKDQPMKKVCLTLALAGGFVVPTLTRAQFANSVYDYTEGSGVTAAYNDPTAALGAPSTETVDPIYGSSPVDPFDAPYLASQIVGVGTGGTLTLQFNTPIQNSPNHPYGLDFIIFGHAGFVEDFGTGTAVDGSLYTGGTSDVRVSVSTDGLTFYTLNPALAPQVDGLFPTDGSGNPFLPVNPSLTAADFAGLDLAGIRALYNGSAGGAGFSLAWAEDSNGDSVLLSSVNYVRLTVLNDGSPAYIDAISVVPEPATWTLALTGAGCFLLRRRVR